MRINPRFYIIAVTAVIIFSAWLFLFDKLLFNIWFGLFLVILFSWLSCKYSLQEIQVSRYSRKKILEVGEIFDERLEIMNGSKFKKFWIEVRDRSELMAKISSRVITSLGPKAVAIFPSTVILNKRGFYLLGPTELISGDPFGLFTSSKLFHFKNNLVVYPKISVLRNFPLLPSDKTGGTSLHLQTKHPTPQAAGVREYSPGDPLSRVHWPTTLRKEKLMVKEFDDDSQAGLWLLLDAQKGIYIHQDGIRDTAIDRNYISAKKIKEFVLPRNSFEYAVSIAASISKYFLARNLAVGFASAGVSVTSLPPEKGHRQFNKIMEKLAIIKDFGTTPFRQLIERQAKNIAKGCAIILITSTSDQPNEIMMNVLNLKGFHPFTILVDNATFVQENSNPDGITISQSGSLKKVSFGDNISKVLSAH